MKDKEWFKTMLVAGMHRFIGEDAPFWRKSAIEKLATPLNINNPVITETLQELVDEGLIYLTKDETYYFVLTEKFVLDSFGAGTELGDYTIKQIKELKEKLSIK